MVLLLSMCKEVEEPKKFGDNYFPLGIGNQWVYEVDSIQYSDFGSAKEEFRVYRRETVVSDFTLDNGETRYMIDVEYKGDSSEWSYHHSYIAYKDNFRAVRSIENREIVHLIFPVKDRVSWDGNQLNSGHPDRFRYMESEKFRSAMRDSFQSSVFVLQSFDTTVVDEDIRWELYAEDIGLVEKNTVSLQKQFNKSKGFEYHWRLLSFTK